MLNIIFCYLVFAKILFPSGANKYDKLLLLEALINIITMSFYISDALSTLATAHVSPPAAYKSPQGRTIAT